MSKIDAKTIKAVQTMPTVKSTDVQWMEWAKTVQNKYGDELGDQIVLGAWKKRGSREANTNALRAQFLKYGIEIDSSAWDKVVDVGVGVGNAFSKAFKVGKVVLITGGIVVGVIAIGMVYNALKTGTSPLKMIKR